MTEPFSQEERDHYRSLVALFIHGDQSKKKLLDSTARVQLASVRETLPHADKETIVTFLLSMAYAMAKVLATPVGEIAEMANAIFQNNVTAAANTMGVYDFDDTEDMPLFDAGTPGHGHANADVEKRIDEIINRQYM